MQHYNGAEADSSAIYGKNLPQYSRKTVVLHEAKNSQKILNSRLMAHLPGTRTYFGDCFLQVIHHRPYGQHSGSPYQPYTPDLGVDDAKQCAVE